MTNRAAFLFRFAELKDLDALHNLMDKSIRRYIGDYLSPEQVEASFEIMGVDTSLIRDETYFAAVHDNQIVGCGGWSRRATLFGSDHTAGRDARMLDPLTEPARIRAMYTHPDFGRQGIATTILSMCTGAARRAGFRNLELMATVSGEPLYAALGFSEIERIQISTSGGPKVPLIRMGRKIE